MIWCIPGKLYHLIPPFCGYLVFGFIFLYIYIFFIYLKLCQTCSHTRHLYDPMQKIFCILIVLLCSSLWSCEMNNKYLLDSVSDALSCHNWLWMRWYHWSKWHIWSNIWCSPKHQSSELNIICRHWAKQFHKTHFFIPSSMTQLETELLSRCWSLGSDTQITC